MDPSEANSYGRAFIMRLIGILLLAAAAYVVAHVAVVNEQINWHAFADMKGSGEVTFKNLDSVDWYLGTDRAEPVMKVLRDRNAQIVEANTRLRADINQLRAAFAQAAMLAGFESQVREGKYTDAFGSLQSVSTSLTQQARATLNTAAIGDRLFELQRLADLQRATLEDLTPPSAQLFFWTKPSLSMLEVLCWALFGVLTNLIYNSAFYVSKRSFDPNERHVAYTKLVYGPILAMVLVLAIMFGWFDLGPYKARVWTLPLIAFIFGYFSRRTAMLFDKLQDKIFGEAEKSIDEGPARILKLHMENLERLRAATAPVTFTGVIERAKAIALNEIAIASANGVKS